LQGSTGSWPRRLVRMDYETTAIPADRLSRPCAEDAHHSLPHPAHREIRKIVMRKVTLNCKATQPVLRWDGAP
jgi:hypothetical protein